MHFKSISEIPFTLGSYFYVDMAPDATGLWTLERSERWGETGSGTATFSMLLQDAPQGGACYGTFKISVEGTEAGHAAATIDSFGHTGKKWAFAFSLAHDHTIES